MKPPDHSSQTPAPLLQEHLSLFPKGRAVDIASGYGRNAFYLAEQGFQVEGFDRDEVSVAFCNEKAERLKSTFTAKVCNLEKDNPFSERSYALASCFYYLDRNIIPLIKNSLKLGGVMVYETFLIDQHKRYAKPSRSAFCWEHNELLKHFLDFRVLYYYEGAIFPDQAQNAEAGRWVAQIIAERLS